MVPMSCSVNMNTATLQGCAPVEVAHVAGLDNVGLCIARFADALGGQPLLVLLQLLLVRGRDKFVLVAK